MSLNKIKREIDNNIFRQERAALIVLKQITLERLRTINKHIELIDNHLEDEEDK